MRRLLLLWSATILAIFLTLLPGCSSVFDVPKPMIFNLAPTPVKIDDLHSSFTTDDTAAQTKYVNKNLWFSNLTVDYVQAWFRTGPHYQSLVPTQIRSPRDYFMTVGSVRFEPRDPLFLEPIVPGSVVDVVGTCQGMQHGTITVTDCWIKWVGGVVGFGGGY